MPNVPHKAEATKLLTNSHHGELEDHSTISWGLLQCENSGEAVAKVDVLQCEDALSSWDENVCDDDLERIAKVISLRL
jgi:hypothetical protein